MTTTQERQMMLDGSLVPTARLGDDIVVCVDGSECRHADAYYDCEGEPHRTDEDKHERDVEVVSDFLDGVGKWAEEYCTENTDYADGYGCIVSEGCYNWNGYVREWVENEYHNNPDLDDYIDEIVEKVCEELDGDFDCEPEFSWNEYAAYSGDGCCLDSFEVGEYEDQIEINEHAVLRVLHDRGELDDVLDDVNCDVCVSRSRRREKNEKTGRYEYVGRETYMPYGRERENPDLMVYTYISGRWHFVVSADRMNDLVGDALLSYLGYTE